MRWRFGEPLFTAIPGPERRAWWLSFFQSQQGPGKPDPRDADSHLPGWVATVLSTDWEAPLPQLAAALGQRGVDGLLLRGVLHRYTETELTQARAAAAGPVSTWSPRAGDEKYEFTENAFASIALGMLPPDEVLELVRLSRTRKHVSFYRHGALPGLAMPDSRDRLVFARDRSSAISWESVIPWLAGLETTGIELLLKWIKRSRTDEANALLSEAGAVLHGPGAAPFFFAALDSNGAEAAADWIRTHLSAVQMASLAPRDARRAAVFLRGQKASTALASGRKRSSKKLPIDLAGLPPLVVDGKTLPLKEVAALVKAMQTDEQPTLVPTLKASMSQADLDEFALAILEGWVFSGSVAKFDWLMTGAAWLGGSAFVAALEPLFAKWRGSRHKVASRGVVALERVGTEDAVRQLALLAEGPPLTSLTRHANDALRRIARDRNLSRQDLEDQAYFSTGLDERGEREFSYGTRRFRARLTPDGRLVVRTVGSDGKPTGRAAWNPPAALAADSPELVA